MTQSSIRIEEVKFNQDRLVGRILRDLPEYFGFETAIVDYCDSARRSGFSTFGAVTQNNLKVGFGMLCMNNEMTAQIWVMAVLREFHRQGAGKLLLEKMEDESRARGRQYILAKTIGPSQNDSNYLKTYDFYCRNGYTMVLEDSDHIWGGCFCALMVKKL